MFKDSGIEEKEPEELEKFTYGKTTLRLLNMDGDYQVEKRNPQGVVNLIDYTILKTPSKGVYNSRAEDAYERIRQARRHNDQFDIEKQGLVLRLDDLDLGMLNLRKPEHLNKPVTSVSDKPMKFTIFPSRELRSHLDFLTVDETV